MVIRSVGITGGTGLLGRHFIKFLLKKKFKYLLLTEIKYLFKIKILVGLKLT